MFASCCLVSAWRYLWHVLSLWTPCRLNAQVKLADNKPVICPTVCITHTLCYSDIMSVRPSHYDVAMGCQYLQQGCIHDVLLQVGRRKTVSVISSSCFAHFLKRRRPSLLHFPPPSVPVAPSYFRRSVPTLALKSPRRMSLSVQGVAEFAESRLS